MEKQIKIKIITFILGVLYTILILQTTALSKKMCLDIIISADLRPYIETAESVKEELSFKSNLYFLNIEGEDHIKKILERSSCKLILGVGYKASFFISKLKLTGKYKFYTLVLYPFLYNFDEKFVCGIKLDIPPELMLKALQPSKGRVAVIFSDKTLYPYIKNIIQTFKEHNVKFEIIRISSTKALKNLAEKIKKFKYIILIPDPIFSSEEIIKSIITISTLNRKIVIGFNRYFLKRGAPISIIADYKQTGKTTAEMINYYLKTKLCVKKTASYKVIIQENILRMLHVEHK